jgi:hypothetical protein
VSKRIFTLGWTPTSVTARLFSPPDSARLMRNESPVEFTYFTSVMSRMNRFMPRACRVAISSWNGGTLRASSGP